MQEVILIISDNIALIDAIEAILTDEGYLIFNGVQENIILYFEENLPQLVLLDIDLKCEDGNVVYKRIKDSNLSNIPLIVFYNKLPCFTISKTDLIIEKPFDLMKFLIAVNDLVNSSYLSPGNDMPERRAGLI
ncbi:response regulator [Pedobacter chinensis]|nr:hypothetical protein [Pedobacter chinensis]